MFTEVGFRQLLDGPFAEAKARHGIEFDEYPKQDKKHGNCQYPAKLYHQAVFINSYREEIKSRSVVWRGAGGGQAEDTLKLCFIFRHGRGE